MEIISNPVELAKKLVSIRSESGSEGEVAEYIFEYLRGIGLPAEKLEVGDGKVGDRSGGGTGAGGVNDKGVGEGRFCVFVAGEGTVLGRDKILEKNKVLENGGVPGAGEVLEGVPIEKSDSAAERDEVLEGVPIEKSDGAVGLCEVLFINHIDTVPVGEGWKHNPYGEIVDGKLYGRGSCDNKGSGAALLAALLAALAGRRRTSGSNLTDQQVLLDHKKIDHVRLPGEKNRKTADLKAGGSAGKKSARADSVTDSTTVKSVRTDFWYPSICFTIGEENTFIGIKTFIKKMAQDERFKNIKYCINLEPTELKIVRAHKGQIHLTIRAKGKAAHASDPSKGENAILKLNTAINNLREFGDRLAEVKHELLGNSTMNIGVIKGGTASNTVPDFAEMEVDIRIVPGQDGGKVVEEIAKAVGGRVVGGEVGAETVGAIGGRIVGGGTGVKGGDVETMSTVGTSDSGESAPLEVVVNHIYSPVEMPSSSPFIENFRKILREEGVDSEPEIGGYTTEFSDLAEAGIEGFIFGAGSINQAHKIDEFVEGEQVEKLYMVLRRFLGD